MGAGVASVAEDEDVARQGVKDLGGFRVFRVWGFRGLGFREFRVCGFRVLGFRV